MKLLDQDFHGYQSLQSAKATMEDVANSINEVMKEKKKLAELIRDIKKDIQKDIKRWAGKDVSLSIDIANYISSKPFMQTSLIIPCAHVRYLSHIIYCVIVIHIIHLVEKNHPDFIIM